MPKISVIIVSYNTRDITERCLKSLALDNFKDKEIIVVDNASSDSSAEMISKKFPEVKLIKLDKNIGFGRGNNLGMSKAKGEYLLLLNSDAFVSPDTLEKCELFMREVVDCDVLGCKLTFDDGRLQPSAGNLPNFINTWMWMWGIGSSVHPKNRLYFESTHPVGWVTGAFMFMRRIIFEKTGGFDENFFMYMEEIDWCKRILESGMKIYFTNKFSIVHLQGASSNYDLKKPLTREVQGLIYYFKKHYLVYFPLMYFFTKVGIFTRAKAHQILGHREKAEIYLEIGKNL
jgi:N-acetylglucosaminyl-diphospho-decaprenol L-rhamnosyltransferase